MSRDRKKTSVTTLGGADFRNVPNDLGAAGDTVYVSPTIKMATQQKQTHFCDRAVKDYARWRGFGGVR